MKMTLTPLLALMAALVMTLANPASLRAQDNTDQAALPTIEIKKARGGLTTTDVKMWLTSLKSIQSKFIQTNPDGGTARGTFSMERPGKVRFEYDDDVPLLIVSDGKTLNMVDYDMGEVTRWPVKDTPLAVLLDKDFAFSKHARLENVEAGGLANLYRVSASDPKRPEMGTITLIIADNGGDITRDLDLRAWQVIDAQGSLTRVSLLGVASDVTFTKDHWLYDDPRGSRFKRRRR